MSTRTKIAALAVVVAVGGVVLEDDGSGGSTASPVPPAATTPARPVVPAPSPISPAPSVAAGTPGSSSATSDLRLPAAHGDGDSWRDTDGREYRLGLVNTPEQDECFGAQATAERRARTAGGFRAEVYATDRYGRAVAVVTTADGIDLNVHLARHGFADDRFLADFRSENEALASRLDAAFAAARREGKGLWSACRSADLPTAVPVPAPAVGGAGTPGRDPSAGGAATAGCHPDYSTCVPVRGDGSGGGGANDLDCGDVTGAVQVRQPGADPYRFDADGDGVGCDS